MTSRRLTRATTISLGLALSVTAVPMPVRAAVPVTSPQPTETTGTPETTGPAKITVTDLAPGTIRPRGPVTVQAKLTNDGAAPLSRLRVQLRTGARLTTRSALADADADPPPDSHGAGGWSELAASLPAGHTMSIRYQTTATALRLSRIGVYPAELTVEGVDGTGSGRQQVGNVRTYLPYLAGTVAGPTEVSWLIPLVDRPHRLTEESTFDDDTLAGELGVHGRLTNLLHLAGVADHAHVPFTLAVDPDLIDSVVAMRQGYTVQVGRTRVAGTGRQSAAQWMNQLVSLTGSGRHMVITLPYGDADTVAVVQAGLPSLAQTQRETVTRLSGLLQTTVSTQVAWPDGGLLTDQALDLVTRNQDAVVLASAALSQPPAGITQDATSPLGSAAGDAVGLVADAGLAQVLADAGRIPGGPRLTEQRYLAELAMITAEQPSVRRRVLVAPPHRWDPNPTAPAAMLVDTTTVPWLAAGTVRGLITAPRVPRGTLVYPPDAPSISSTQVSRVRAVQTQVDDFRSALDNAAANTLLEPFIHALGRAASSAWRDDATGGVGFVYRLGARIATVRTSVHIVRPDIGQYTLGGQHSDLPLTVVNELPVPVQVKIQITCRSGGGLRATNTDVVTLPARRADGPPRRVQLRVPVTLTRSGRLQVSAGLTTPDGRPVSSPVPLEVQSNAYGTVALGITGAALVLLVLLVVRRLYRRVRRRPDTEPEPTPAGSPAERAT